MTDELLNALRLIKAECEKHSKLVSVSKMRSCCKCNNCPLSASDGDCGVTQIEPSEWSLEKREVYF